MKMAKKIMSPALPMPVMSPELSMDLPDEETMQSLHLTPVQFPDFIKALKATILQTQGLSITESCERVDIARRSFYEEKWQILFEKAQRLVTAKMMLGVSNARNYVMEAWPRIIRGQVQIALTGAEDKDRITATQLLFSMFPQLGQTEGSDESAELNYLKSPPSFNPLQPIQAIQAQAGSTIIFNQPGLPSINAEIVND